jgi:hypothetical protein
VQKSSQQACRKEHLSKNTVTPSELAAFVLNSARYLSIKLSAGFRTSILSHIRWAPWIATRYGLDGTGFRSRLGDEIFHNRLDRQRGPPKPLYNGPRFSFPGVKQGVALSTYHYPALRLYLYRPTGPFWSVLGYTFLSGPLLHNGVLSEIGQGRQPQNILDFKLRLVLNVVYFLLGNSPASEFYMPTFRNTLSVPSS